MTPSFEKIYHAFRGILKDGSEPSSLELSEATHERLLIEVQHFFARPSYSGVPDSIYGVPLRVVEGVPEDEILISVANDPDKSVVIKLK